jgi:hypothetical protein
MAGNTAEEAALLAVMNEETDEAKRILDESTLTELRTFARQVSRLADMIADARAEKIEREAYEDDHHPAQ